MIHKVSYKSEISRSLLRLSFIIIIIIFILLQLFHHQRRDLPIVDVTTYYLVPTSLT